MYMLKQFLLGKTDLFKNLKICTEEGRFFLKNCKLHPVIHIDLGDVRGANSAEVKVSLALAINATFQELGYLMKKTDDGTRIWASEKLNISAIEVESFEKFYDTEKCIRLSGN
ncbi:hypothetical protein Zmor_018609 [Zophobas morio]|uniref:Uncharacterized protein n=1 Tax=Zophobas morio TaxID=2755281 RepID=A0AA38I7R8_9CUCU|nr:hypothetical protein Zmor_018609 [Zophobas morio]